jgi:Acyl-CoA dehydrogenase, C-terminal domain
LRDERFDLRSTPHVGAYRQSTELARNLPYGLKLKVGYNHSARALGREPPCQGTTDAARGTGDHDVAIGQLHPGTSLVELEARFNSVLLAPLLTLKAAWLMDTVGNKHARMEISAIKIAAPNVALRVVDRAIQVFGGAGVSDDTPLAMMYAHLRRLRLADGPDEIHKRTLARDELRRFKRPEPVG